MEIDYSINLANSVLVALFSIESMYEDGLVKRATSNDPKKVSRNLAAKLSRSRKKAQVLLDKWADERTDVELGVLGIFIAGKLVRFGLAPEGGDFIFKSPFGISNVIFLSIYDEIIVESTHTVSTRVILSAESLGATRVVISPLTHSSHSEEQFSAACNQFRTWMKVGVRVMFQTGDRLRTTMTRCVINEPESGVFLFTSPESGLLHIVRVSESGSIYVDRSTEKTLVLLHCRESNSFCMITDADSPEEAMSRFALSSQFVN